LVLAQTFHKLTIIHFKLQFTTLTLVLLDWKCTYWGRNGGLGFYAQEAGDSVIFFLKGGAQEAGGSLGAGLLVQGGGDFEKSSLATGKSLQKNGEHLCRKWHHWGGVGGEGGRDWGWGWGI
jgi:hypothetical protein